MAGKASTSQLPPDEDVKTAIFSALRQLDVDEVRPNKLRKIVCKRVVGSSWTQFQENLESLIESGEIRVGKGSDGDRVVRVNASLTQGCRAVNSEEDPVGKAASNTKHEVSSKSIDVRVPRAVVLHLTRKSHRKQKNIESNTKTKIRMNGKELQKKNIAAINDDEVTITICAETCANDEGLDSSEVDAAIDRRLKAAKILIEQMIKSYEKHPDHFAARKAGGSFEDQEKEKKRRQYAQQHRHGKKRKVMGKKEIHDKDKGGKRPEASEKSDVKSSSKKRRRKFY